MDGTPILDGNPIKYRIIFDGSAWPNEGGKVTIDIEHGQNPHGSYGGNLTYQLGSIGTGYTLDANKERTPWKQVYGGFGWQRIILPSGLPKLDHNLRRGGGDWRGVPFAERKRRASWSFKVDIPMYCESKGEAEAFIWGSDTLDNFMFRQVFQNTSDRRPIPILVGGASFSWEAKSDGLDVKQVSGYPHRINASEAGNVNFFSVFKDVYGTDLESVISM